jgi:hypothetical protein
MPKKAIKNEKMDGGKILNMYEYLPEDLLVEPENPNFKLHNLKIPFRMLIVSYSSGGKTNFLTNLLLLFSQGKGTFASITIVTRNKDEPLYNWMTQKSDQIQVKEGLHSLPDLDKFDKDLNHLVVMDDLMLSKNQSKAEQYFIRARKLNCSVIYIAQSFYRTSKIIRSNLSYLVLLKIAGARDLNMILSEVCIGLNKETLKRMYEFCTKEKFNCLLIDLEKGDPTQRYRHNLLQILNPQAFVQEIMGSAV